MIRKYLLSFWGMVFILTAIPFTILLADREELFWVKVSEETGTLKLSDGRSAPPGAVAGQYYESEKGRLKPEKQWRPPLDILYEYKGGTEGRVVFSHERHFSFTGNKKCSTCHDDSFGLGESGMERKSQAPAGKESHASESLGRFCSSCHNGETKFSEVTGQTPETIKPDQTIFTAFSSGRKEDCSRCHAPSDHGRDFTDFHGEEAEHGSASSCLKCHRGSESVSPLHRRMALDFRNAQLTLVKDPENKPAFSKVLPPVFCMYCHNSDSEPWEKHRDR